MRDYSKLLSIAKNNNGYIFTKDVVMENIPKTYLNYATNDGVIEKVAFGVYVLPEIFVDDLYVFQKINSKVIYSSFTSAYLLGLTTRDSEMIFASIPKSYNPHRFNDKGCFIREDLSKYNLGITTVITMFGNSVQCHDIHRTICDLFSKKYEGDKFVQVESLKNYLKLKDKNISKLMMYAKELQVDRDIRERLEVLL